MIGWGLGSLHPLAKIAAEGDSYTEHAKSPSGAPPVPDLGGGGPGEDGHMSHNKMAQGIVLNQRSLSG